MAPVLGGRSSDPDLDPDPKDGHSAAKLKAVIWSVLEEATDECAALDLSHSIFDLPNECLACVFQDLGFGNRGRCSLFDSVTKLALKCDRKSLSIDDDTLVLISLKCRNLTHLKLQGCRVLTNTGIAIFTSNCWWLRKLLCGSCAFRAKGMNAVIDHCASLEELSVK
ncbi:hypothetical protein EUGRSUZ_H04564 [Eucalyptus grandis]|uniref:Uncharacterized protein n=2 Tax=Eucalyptus grandis TaxID=71139 RepID=A0ACC3JXY9_EUCGR|nr:hypothetical protein EUGRSUZ_H04564 [Eucalyptus grandis]